MERPLMTLVTSNVDDHTATSGGGQYSFFNATARTWVTAEDSTTDRLERVATDARLSPMVSRFVVMEKMASTTIQTVAARSVCRRVFRQTVWNV